VVSVGLGVLAARPCSRVLWASARSDDALRGGLIPPVHTFRDM
jgi:hypothetical protein